MRRIVPVLLAALLTACSALADLSVNEDPVIYAVRPAVSARTEFEAVDFLANANASITTRQLVGCLGRPGVSSKHSANYLYVQSDLLQDPQVKLFAYRLALSREKQAALCMSVKAPSDLGSELASFLGASLAINMIEQNSRVAEQRVEAEFKARASGFLEQNIAFGANVKNIHEGEMEIAGIIDPDVAATSIFKSKQPRVRKAIEGIIDEQEARAKASWNKLTHQQIYGLLVGTHSPAGNWEFLNGELTSLKVDSVTFKGHCVLTELTLNLVGKSAGARTIKIRAAFTVFKDGGIGLIGTN